MRVLSLLSLLVGPKNLDLILNISYVLVRFEDLAVDVLQQVFPLLRVEALVVNLVELFFHALDG